MFLIVFSFLVSAFAIYVWLYYENVKRYPKGPTPIPLFGNLLSANIRKLHEQISDYAKIYGGVYTIWLPQPFVVITDYELMKDAFAKKGDEFSGRPRGYPSNIFQMVENGGVVNSEGDNWKEQRRTSLHILRDFGMGKNLMEEQVLLSAQDFLAHLDSINNKESVDLRHPLQVVVEIHFPIYTSRKTKERILADHKFIQKFGGQINFVFIANIINKTLFGFSYKYDRSDRLMEMADQLTKVLDDIKDSKLLFFTQMFPSLHRLPVIGHLARDRFETMMGVVKDKIREDVERCLKSYKGDQEPECFVHAYYERMQKNSALDHGNLLSVCLDFFIAGMETTTTTLRWSSLFLAKNIEVQDKIRDEIFSVLGADGKPSTSHRSRMPYTCAAIQEIQRCANILPINVFHRTTKETSIGSIPIPENTHILGHIHYILSRSPAFDSPKEFRPERFLLEDGVTPNKETVEQLCPFSIGKRQCAGEALARVELFIGLVTLLQNYKIEPAKGHEIDLEPIFAAVLLPKPQPLRLIPILSQ